MAQTLVSIYLHIIFSTKLRQKLIPVELEGELYKYIGGICRNLDCALLEGNGMDDHSHCLVSMTKNASVMHLQQELKKSSSKWMNRKTKFKFGWQGGYGALSVSPSKLQRVRQYIRNQKSHHSNMSFEQEYEEILRKHGCEYDEKYFLD